jgi:hypothetical protein
MIGDISGQRAFPTEFILCERSGFSEKLLFRLAEVSCL